MHNLTKIKIFRIALWMTYPLAVIFIYPFVLLRKKNSTHLFFFFDRYAIGGAQRIHIDILESVADIGKQVYFTRKSPNDKLKDAFYSIPNTDNKDIHFWCDNLLFRLFTVHFYAFYLNRHKKAHVFSSNSTFFYDMISFLSKHVHTTELLHNFSYGKNGMEFFGLANHQRLDNRVVYDNFTLSNIRKQYKEYGVNDTFLQRILFIEPGIDVPAKKEKDYSLPIRILYAGRGGPQKRVWLINRIAESILTSNLPVQFEFVGPMADELSEFIRSRSVIHGEVGSKNKMYDLYAKNHLLILTSAYEGFPMVIKEAMANGTVPLVTALEGNKMHLKHEENALLIDAVEDEEEVVAKGIYQIKYILENQNQLATLSTRAYEYARLHFTKQPFFNKYRKFLLS